MYTLTLPIPIAIPGAGRVLLPQGLARDLLAQLGHEPAVRLLAPAAPNAAAVTDPLEISLAEHPGLSVRTLPWTGGARSWWISAARVARVLAEEAPGASVWHAGVGLGLFDLNALAFRIGLRHSSGLRVLCLDSDPAAMLEQSGGLARLRAPLVRNSLRRRTQAADLVIFVGRGAEQSFGRAAKASIRTHAVWLCNDDLADPDGVSRKFAALRENDPVPAILATRLAAWKGVDDAIEALARRREALAPIRLDVIGEGSELARLRRLVERLGLGDRVRFLDPVPYGAPFFSLLRGYALALVPTRGLEEARILYDAAASGCVLVHSKTSTLEAALDGLEPRFRHEPGNPDDLARALEAALSARAAWPEAARAGLARMRGRTIDEMHRERAKALAMLRSEAQRGGKASIHSRTGT